MAFKSNSLICSHDRRKLLCFACMHACMYLPGKALQLQLQLVYLAAIVADGKDGTKCQALRNQVQLMTVPQL